MDCNIDNLVSEVLLFLLQVATDGSEDSVARLRKAPRVMLMNDVGRLLPAVRMDNIGPCRALWVLSIQP